MPAGKSGDNTATRSLCAKAFRQSRHFSALRPVPWILTTKGRGGRRYTESRALALCCFWVVGSEGPPGLGL